MAAEPRGAEGREMDTPPLSESDSESDACLASDQEVGRSGASGAGAGTGTLFSSLVLRLPGL